MLILQKQQTNDFSVFFTVRSFTPIRSKNRTKAELVNILTHQHSYRQFGVPSSPGRAGKR